MYREYNSGFLAAVQNHDSLPQGTELASSPGPLWGTDLAVMYNFNSKKICRKGGGVGGSVKLWIPVLIQQGGPGY